VVRGRAKRLLVAGSPRGPGQAQLSGKILEKVEMDPERFRSGAASVQFM
jgi:hypothetical protein